MTDLLANSSSEGVPAPGSILVGKYQVQSVLGAGGMGIVLQARNQRTDQSVAIKLLLPSAKAMPDVVARFEREARAAARIQGPHVVRVYDVDNLPDGSPMMIMELLQGWDLGQELVARGPLPYPEAVEFILQACEAIGQAHQMGIVHRDIKPANLFLCQEGSKRLVKVLDFGISKISGPEDQSQTATSAAFGTPQYMSPEQVRSTKHVDGRADIWSLGCVLYELLGGRAPFSAATATATLAAIIADAPEDLRNLRPDLPPKLSAAVMKALEKRVDDRFQDVGAFVAALNPFSSKHVSAMTVPHIVAPEARAQNAQNAQKRTMRLALIAGGISTVVVGIGLAALALSVSSSSSSGVATTPVAPVSAAPTIAVIPAAPITAPAATETSPALVTAAPMVKPTAAPQIKSTPSLPTTKPIDTRPPPSPAPKPVEDPTHL